MSALRKILGNDHIVVRVLERISSLGPQPDEQFTLNLSDLAVLTLTEPVDIPMEAKNHLQGLSRSTPQRQMQESAINHL